LRRVLQIHVTEEARHVRFAELSLRERLPHASTAKLRSLRWAVPVLLRDSQRMMLSPTPRLQRRFGFRARSCASATARQPAPGERGGDRRALVELLGAHGVGLRVFA